MEKISITRALSEVKLLEKKIHKKINEFTPCDLVIGNKPPVGFENVDMFKEHSKAKYQGIQDLIARRSEIKRKIVLSNAITMVTIAGLKMTVAEAIDYKNSVVLFRSNLSNRIATVFNKTASRYEQSMNAVKENVDRQLEAMFGRDKKVTQEEIDTISKPYIENNGPKFIDCISCEKEHNSIQEEVDNFILEVDHTLSESNATTFIEIN